MMMKSITAVILFCLLGYVVAGKGKGMKMSMGMSLKKSSHRSSKGKGYFYYKNPYPSHSDPPYGAPGVPLPAKPDWIIYGGLQSRFGVSNAENVTSGDLTGALSYGVDAENPVFLDEATTLQAGSFAFNSRFVGDTTVPALITGALTIFDERGTSTYGVLFLQGIQNADFSVDLAIVGGSGHYVGVTGQIYVPPIGTEAVPIEVYFF